MSPWSTFLPTTPIGPLQKQKELSEYTNIELWAGLTEEQKQFIARTVVGNHFVTPIAITYFTSGTETVAFRDFSQAATAQTITIPAQGRILVVQNYNTDNFRILWRINKNSSSQTYNLAQGDVYHVFGTAVNNLVTALNGQVPLFQILDYDTYDSDPATLLVRKNIFYF